jgi:hypothetical protein
MEKNDLMDIAKIYVKLHNLIKEDEEQLLEKINNFKNDDEILEFLYTSGRFVLKEDDKDLKDEVIRSLWNHIYSSATGGDDWEDRIQKISNVYNDLAAGAYRGAQIVAVLLIIALVIRALKRIRAEYFVKAVKACQKLEGVKKNICIVRSEVNTKRMELGVVKRGLDTCSKSKNPADCKQKLGYRLEKIKSDILKKQVELKTLMEKSRNKK